MTRLERKRWLMYSAMGDLKEIDTSTLPEKVLEKAARRFHGAAPV
jgi:hypothetical protein